MCCDALHMDRKTVGEFLEKLERWPQSAFSDDYLLLFLSELHCCPELCILAHFVTRSSFSNEKACYRRIDADDGFIGESSPRLII